jgi:hypothetical protein
LNKDDGDVLPEALLNKSKLCKHKFSCTENVLKGWYKSFIYALLIKSVINNITSIVNPRKFLSNLLDMKQNFDSMRFAIFAAFMNGIYKMVLCIMRRYSKSDKVNAAVAGFASGLALAIDDKKRRVFIALLLLGRSLECLLNSLEFHGIITKIPYGEQLLFTVCGTFNKYCFSYESSLLDPGLRKFYQNASMMSKNDIKFLKIWNTMHDLGKA